MLSGLFSVYGTKFMPMQYALLNELYYLFYRFNFLYIEPSFSLLFFTGVISNILELFFFLISFVESDGVLVIIRQ